MTTRTTSVYVKQGDTSPALQARLLNRDNTPLDLTGATVDFRMVSEDGTVTVTGACVIDDDVGGEVSYSWAEGDTDLVGKHFAEFKVTKAGKVQTCPTVTPLTVMVVDDI